jgi:hypothetical protein
VRFTALQSIVCVRPVGLLVPHAASPRCFHRKKRDSEHRPPPLTRSASSSHELLVPLQSSSFSTLPHLSVRNAFLGVPIVLFATSTGSVHTVASQGHSLAVLDVSHVLDGLLRSRPCGFVSPHCRVQDFPFRGSFLMHSRSTLSVSLFPLAVGAVCLQAVTRLRQLASPRPQGFSPYMNPLPSRWCLVTVPARSPPGFLLLQVLTFDVVGMPSHPLALMTFRKKSHSGLFRPPTAFRPPSNLACLSRGCRPVRGFWPSA